MSQGMVFNIQRFSIHDGPGIRTTIFLKGCPLRCFWCQNPESQRSIPEIFYFADKCIGCLRCVQICPKAAIIAAQEGKVETDRNRCIGCAHCVTACPVSARTLMGKDTSVEDIMTIVRKDMNFYRTSGGGVTISGGDPVAQPQFASAILKQCKNENIHTLIETCAYADWNLFERLIEYVDMIYMDIKCIDAALHKRCTGVSNEKILNNAVRASRVKPIRVRVPVIPGFNDDLTELMKIFKFVRTEMNTSEIELLKFNSLCESKYIRLDREYENHSRMTNAELEVHMDELRKFLGAIE